MRRLLLLVLLGSCTQSTPPPAKQPQSTAEKMRERCCAECGQASRRDPAGMDIRGKTCTSYPAEWNGGPGVSDECRAWFVAQPEPPLVGDCWALAGARDAGVP